MAKEEKEAAEASRRDRFTEAARALGADEDEGRFREKLARIARQKPAATPDKCAPEGES